MQDNDKGEAEPENALAGEQSDQQREWDTQHVGEAETVGDPFV